MSRQWLLGLAVCSLMLAACSSSMTGPASTTTTVNPASIDAINCPNTWQLTSVQRGLNRDTRRSVLATNVIPPNALWVAFCLYGLPSSGTSNAGGTETLVQKGADLASKQHALITEINEGQVIKAPDTYHCPADNGQTYLLMFTYHQAPIVRVAAYLFGCRFTTNGVTTVLSLKAHAQLIAMAGAHTQGAPPIPMPTAGA